MMLGDRVWGRNKVSDLVTGGHIEEDGRGRYYLVEGFSWFEAKCRAYDSGHPEVALDAIQLERSVDQITDLPVKAALQLRMLGWDPLDIAAVLHDRKHRPAPVLLDQGLTKLLRIERQRKGSAEGN